MDKYIYLMFSPHLHSLKRAGLQIFFKQSIYRRYTMVGMVVRWLVVGRLVGWFGGWLVGLVVGRPKGVWYGG